MEFVAGDFILTIEGKLLTIKPQPVPKRTSNIFYAVLFLWFIYLFLKRIVKVETSVAFNWFMVLLFGAVAIYYSIIFIIWIIRGKQQTKYDIQKIIAAGIVEKGKHIYAFWQMQDKRFISMNFLNALEEAQAFVATLQEKNENISPIER